MDNHGDSYGRAPDLAGQRAGDLIRAWISGDAGRFASEIESILRDATGAGDAGEEERRNLLRAVALRMKKCPHVFDQPQNAGIELCLNLLGHLVAEETGRAASGWQGTIRYRSRECGSGIGNGSRPRFRLTLAATGMKSTLRMM